jgi:cobalt-zinc-cadmium resistance protein CzcA
MHAIVAAALKQRILVIILAVTMMVGGVFAYSTLNIEAYPDPVPPLVDIITQNPGQSSEEIERYITVPIEIQMAGLAQRPGDPHHLAVRLERREGPVHLRRHLRTRRAVRHQSPVAARSAARTAPSRCCRRPPRSAKSSATASSGRPATRWPTSRPSKDWVLQRRFKAIAGVIDVTGWGGKTKTYDITVDLDRLLAYGLTLKQVVDGLNNANINVGANTVNIGPQSAIVRSVGQIRSMDDIRNTMLAGRDGAPVLVSDVATVTVGNQPRLGIAGQNNDDDIVQGIVLMRRGAETLPTLSAVLAEVDRINNTNVLPPGVRIERIYDRSALVEVTTHTVLYNMVLGVVLIFFIQWLFLGDLRSALIVSATIPFALLFAVVILVLNGESANLLSMGAIDFGIIVDATVIMVENIYRHLAEASHGGRVHDKTAVIYRASTEVTQAIFFSATIIIAGFLPLFTLSGVEGHIFGPMARTYAYALAGGLIATFTVSPALSVLLMPDAVGHTETRIVRALSRFYGHVRDTVLAHRRTTMAAGVAVGMMAVGAGSSIGLEFLPKLEEGNMWIRAVMPASISLEAGNDYANRMRKLIKGFPEAETVISQHGRPDDGTDSTGFFNAEFFVPLKPFDKWRKGVDKDALIAEINDALTKAFPGVEFTFSQYIQDNVQEAASGVKGENSSRCSATTSRRWPRIADDIKNAIATVPGVTDLAVSASLGQPTIRIDIDRAQGGALWAGAGRYQRHGAGGDRRPGRRRRLRKRQRPSLPDGRAAGAALPRESRGDQAHPDRRADRQGRDPGAAQRGRQRRPRLGCLLHLPRAAGALRAGQVLGARPRPRRRRAGGAAARRREGPHPGRLPSRVGRRVRQPQERAAPAGRSPCRSRSR